MQISEWNRNTSLLALQLSVDYLLRGVDDKPEGATHSSRRAPTRSRQVIAAGHGNKPVVREARTMQTASNAARTTHAQ